MVIDISVFVYHSCSLLFPSLVSSLSQAIFAGLSNNGLDPRSSPVVSLLQQVIDGAPEKLKQHLVNCDILPDLLELADARKLQLVSIDF